MASELRDLKRMQQQREAFFTLMIVATVVAGACLPILVTNVAQLAAIEAILAASLISLLFCRFRAGNCANSIGFALHFYEQNDKRNALQAMKQSDCIKTADHFIGRLNRVSEKANSNKSKEGQ